ncbi:MAG: DMT family transporter [Gammaproteobacteria bacterium]|nr:DMT family transporter [Gammaproteobacteria bacterium]
MPSLGEQSTGALLRRSTRPRSAWSELALTQHWTNILSPTMRGMLLMVFSTICFTTMQGLIRVVASGADALHPIEIAFFRNVFGVVALTPVFLRLGLRVLHTQRLSLHVTRAMIQSAGMVSFFVALTMIPISEVTALSFSAPLFATVLAVIVFRERIRLRRISALLIGFVGVLIILRPGESVMSAGAILVICSSLGWAIAMLVIKTLTKTDSPVTMTAYAALLMSPVTLVPALFFWTWPTLPQFGLLLCIGIVGTLGHVSFASAFREAELSAILPLDFLRLIWASLFGYFVFAESPSVFTWTGGLMIFASATYIAIREARLSRTP